LASPLLAQAAAFADDKPTLAAEHAAAYKRLVEVMTLSSLSGAGSADAAVERLNRYYVSTTPAVQAAIDSGLNALRQQMPPASAPRETARRSLHERALAESRDDPSASSGTVTGAVALAAAPFVDTRCFNPASVLA
jgi:hypothetical protein